MDKVSQFSRPLVVDAFEHGASVQGLTRVHLNAAKPGAYSEAWLQRLIHRHPSLLPVDQIEPALIPLIPVCIELPTPSGYVDNLFVTPDGDPVLVECKLWRNPEARREVVGQILDYAKDLASWDYEDLETAVRKAARPEAEGGLQGMCLYDLVTGVAAEAELDEARFIDAVSRNLRRGRFLLLIVGDGIQAGAERLADFLQQHAGLHFTLALVELAIFELPAGGGYLVQPRVPARTLNIERGIVTVDEAANIARITMPATPAGGPKAARRTTISEEKFFEELAAEGPELPDRLRAFLAAVEPLGIRPEYGQASLILRWQPDETHKFNLGYIRTDGQVLTDATNWVADRIGRLDLSHRYIEHLAALVEGGHVRRGSKPTTWHAAVKSGGPVRLPNLLDKQDEWRAAIEEFINAATDALKD